MGQFQGPETLDLDPQTLGSGDPLISPPPEGVPNRPQIRHILESPGTPCWRVLYGLMGYLRDYCITRDKPPILRASK